MGDRGGGAARFYGYVLPLVLVIQFFLGLLLTLDLLDVSYYIMRHRVFQVDVFNLFFDPTWVLLALLVVYPVVAENRRLERLSLLLVSLATVPLLGVGMTVAIISVMVALQGLYIYRCFRHSFLYTLGLSIVLNGLSLVHYLIFSITGSRAFLADLVAFNDTLIYLSKYYTPYVCLIFLFGWLIRPVLTGLKRGEVLERFSAVVVPDDDRALFYLVLICGLNVFMAWYPNLATVNPTGKIIGTDFRPYLRWVTQMEGNFTNVFLLDRGSRSTLFLAMYALNLFLDSNTVVRLMPVFLLPLLSVSAYFLASVVFGNRSVAVWAAFFSSCGVQMTAGMHAYYLSNLLGLSFAFFSIGFLFKAYRSNKSRHLLLSVFFCGLLSFTHPWTLDHYVFIVGVITVELLYGYVTRGVNAKMLFTSLSYLISFLVIELLKGVVFRGVASVSAPGAYFSMLVSLINFWGEYKFSLFNLYGGALSYGLMYVLSFFGLMYLRRRGVSETYLGYLLAVSSLMFLMGDSIIKSRFIYNLPVGLFASLGLLSLASLDQVKPYSIFIRLFVVFNVLAYDVTFLTNLV